MPRRVKGMDFDIGQRVRLARKARGMTQEKLGAHLGVTFQQVQKYENGKNRISASTLFHIAKSLETDLLFFFGDDGSEAGSFAPSELSRATNTDLRIMRGLLKVRDGRRKSSLAQFVEALETPEGRTAIEEQDSH